MGAQVTKPCEMPGASPCLPPLAYSKISCRVSHRTRKNPNFPCSVPTPGSQLLCENEHPMIFAESFWSKKTVLRYYMKGIPEKKKTRDLPATQKLTTTPTTRPRHIEIAIVNEAFLAAPVLFPPKFCLETPPVEVT